MTCVRIRGHVCLCLGWRCTKSCVRIKEHMCLCLEWRCTVTCVHTRGQLEGSVLFTVWFLGIKGRLQGLVGSTFTC